MGIKIPTELIKLPVKYEGPYSGPWCGRALPTRHSTYSLEFLTRKLMTEKSTIIMYIGCTHDSNFPSSTVWVRRIGIFHAYLRCTLYRLCASISDAFQCQAFRLLVFSLNIQTKNCTTYILGIFYISSTLLISMHLHHFRESLPCTTMPIVSFPLW